MGGIVKRSLGPANGLNIKHSGYKFSIRLVSKYKTIKRFFIRLFKIFCTLLLAIVTIASGIAAMSETSLVRCDGPDGFSTQHMHRGGGGVGFETLVITTIATVGLGLITTFV